MRTKWHEKKQLSSKCFLSYFFYQFIRKPFPSHSTLCHVIDDTTFLRKSWLHKKFRSPFAVIIELSKYNEAKKLSGIFCAVVSDHIQEGFKYLWQHLLILQHLLKKYVWNHCDQAVDMVWIAPTWHDVKRFDQISGISEIYESRAFEPYILCPNWLISGRKP